MAPVTANTSPTGGPKYSKRKALSSFLAGGLIKPCSRFSMVLRLIALNVLFTHSPITTPSGSCCK